MSTKSFAQLKALSKAELESKLRESEESLFRTKLELRTGQLKDTAKAWRVRKTTARIKTLLGTQAKA